ncbi:PREDICTED: uncharacterized protein LOC107073475 [Polistes dominula]|uniref:Uncharacterized protein LOC107073475 n=1 Tax=Polistes dominula TaxID=743375 RepID=A0ABM1JB13_POLDO|nr:PREDICTED: uncharacterized protein LOC107073475 [Polistes dominula]
MCRVRKGDGTFRECRALLDACAAAHLITENVSRELRLPIKPYSILIHAINDTVTRTTGVIEITIQSLYNKYSRNLLLFIVPKIADQVPGEVFPRELVKIPLSRKLADHQFHLPRPVDILIGSGATLALMSIGFLATTKLREQLERFRLLEDANITRSKSVNEIDCENHYVKDTKRDESGRYIVRLPFREERHDYSHLRGIALRRFHNLWKKLHANTKLWKEYERIIQEYVDLGHMSTVEDEPTGGFYLLHHAVIKSANMTTKTFSQQHHISQTYNPRHFSRTLVTIPNVSVRTDGGYRENVSTNMDSSGRSPVPTDILVA